MTIICRKLCGGSCGNAVADNKGKQIGANDSQHTPNRSANQPLQAHYPKPPLEHDDGAADQQPCDGVEVRGKIKGADEVADEPDYDNK